MVNPFVVEYQMRGYVPEFRPSSNYGRGYCTKLPGPARAYYENNSHSYSNNDTSSPAMRSNFRSDCPVGSGASGPFKEMR